jgi:hypothetical protein
MLSQQIKYYAISPGLNPPLYVAHIIGFLAGLPFGIALSDHWKRNLLITLLLLAIYLAVVSGAVGLLFAG